jgi:citrate lyase subunit beta/citryl-CoA lyase
MTLRSYLYTPGNRPELFDKALRSSADGVILDLEDSVPAAEKAVALGHVIDFLSEQNTGIAAAEIWVRVNNQPGLLEEELTALAGSDRLAGVTLPKVEDPAVFDRNDQLLAEQSGVIALIESASGALATPEIASHPRVHRLGLGEMDLIADLRMDPSPGRHELTSIRVNVVVASAAARIEQPIGPVSVDIDDEPGLVRSTEELRRLGFGGRSAIHPRQVEVINKVFTPTQPEIDQAEDLVRSLSEATEQGNGVFVDAQGRMIDEAVVRGAHQILEVATRLDMLDRSPADIKPAEREGPTAESESKEESD